MKRLVYSLIVLAAIFAIESCESLGKDGDWDPIELDNQHVTFPPSGGQVTVSTLNYSKWWISGGYNSAWNVSDHWEYHGYVPPTSSDGEEACTNDILDGDWFHVTVPDKGRSNTVVITVDLHYDASIRTGAVEMTVGDAFTTIIITQN